MRHTLRRSRQIEKRQVKSVLTSRRPVASTAIASRSEEHRHHVEPETHRSRRHYSDRLHRRISRFARVRSEDDFLDSLADEMESAGDTDDPKVMRRLMREMGKGLGEDLDEDFEAMMEEERAGESPEDGDSFDE